MDRSRRARWLWLWWLTGAPGLVLLGHRWADEVSRGWVERGRTLGEHTGEGTWAPLLDLGGATVGLVATAVMRLVGPFAGLVLAAVLGAIFEQATRAQPPVGMTKSTTPLSSAAAAENNKPVPHA